MNKADGEFIVITYYEKNREKALRQQREYHATHKDQRREYDKHYQRKRKYGLNAEGFAALLEKQQGRCAICCEILGEGQDTHVDHNHETGKVRGLLCRECNLGIGILKDSPTLLYKAASYLEQTG